MCSATRLFFFVALLLIASILRMEAVSPTTAAVGVYDETTSQQNNVDFNASGNAHNASTGDGATYTSIGSFNSLISGEFLLERGGVANFDDLSNGTTGTVLIVSYAGGAKSLPITFGGGYGISTGITIAADASSISGPNYLESGRGRIPSVSVSAPSITLPQGKPVFRKSVSLCSPATSIKLKPTVRRENRRAPPSPPITEALP